MKTKELTLNDGRIIPVYHNSDFIFIAFYINSIGSKNQEMFPVLSSLKKKSLTEIRQNWVQFIPCDNTVFTKVRAEMWEHTQSARLVKPVWKKKLKQTWILAKLLIIISLQKDSPVDLIPLYLL